MSSLLQKFYQLALALILLCSASFIQANTYTLEDLKILHQQKSYEEFFLHALDPRPSERNESWAQMVAEMAEAWAKHLAQKESLSKIEFDQIESLALWPSLKEVEFFQKYRGQLASQYFRQCFLKRVGSDQSTCYRDLGQFWERSNRDLELAKSLGQLFADYQENYLLLLTIDDALKKMATLTPWTFYQYLAKGDYSQFYCASATVLKAMADHALEMAGSHSLRAPLMDEAFGTYGPECLEHTHKEVLKRFTQTSATQRERAHRWLKTFNRLSEDDQWAYSVQYLLDAPVRSSQMNKAWNDVSKLGQNFPLRQKILRALVAYDPLPDRLFIHSDEQLRDGVAKHLAKNFPEYFESYARSCLNFLKGVGHFPQGNPTIHCTHFFELAQKQSFISEKLAREYQRARNFKK